MSDEQKRNNGGQAFPRSGYDGPKHFGAPIDGMSLRDYFAAKAMQACVERSFSHELGTVDERVTRAAAFAYKLADAMLEARQ